MINQEQIRKKMNELDALPSFRLFTGALKSMADIDEPRDYMAYLTTISKDPALTARVIAAANTAYYYGVDTVSSLKDAADRIGMEKLKSMVLGHILSTNLETETCPTFDKKLYWTSAMLVAVCASHIADNIDNSPLESNVCYSLGLLHNIGVLALVVMFPEEMCAIFSEADENHTISELEKIHFDGLTHYDVGAELIKQWQLPDLYYEVIKRHRGKEYSGEFQKSAQLLGLARNFVENGYQETESYPLTFNHDQLYTILAAYQKDKKWIEEFALCL